MRTRILRLTSLSTWALLLIAFWIAARQADAGPVEYLMGVADEISRLSWAPVAMLALYLLRPVLLVPVTLLNLTSGLLLGPLLGIALAMAGTLLSASMGYGMGRLLGSAELAANLSSRWPFVRMLRARSFEAVVGGGLMYLHADMVNMPAGILRIHFPTFLLGITFGNSLTLTMAVLAGASVEGNLANASLSLNLEYLLIAGSLFLVSVLLAQLLRKRLRPRSDTG